jgi:hypothetical protein
VERDAPDDDTPADGPVRPRNHHDEEHDMAQARRDVYIVNDLPQSGAPVEVLSIGGDNVRATNTNLILTRTQPNQTFQISTIPITGFVVSRVNILVRGEPDIPAAQWQAVTYGASNVPISQLFLTAMGSPQADDWMINNGWQYRSRANYNNPTTPQESDWGPWLPQTATS